MTLDDWKTMSPEDEEEEFECKFCGKPIDEKGFCSEDCKTAYYND